MEADIVFAGKFGSGKTTLARATAEKLGVRYAGFGVTLKRIAAERGIPATRENLQSLGEQLVCDAPDELCRRVIAEREPSLVPMVIDGLRHARIYEILKRLSGPRRLVLVFVTLPNDIRIQRIKGREQLTDAQIKEIDAHSTELEVDSTIRALADLTVDNSPPIEHMVAEITRGLREGR